MSYYNTKTIKGYTKKFDSFSYFSPSLQGRVVYKDGQWQVEIEGEGGVRYVPWMGENGKIIPKFSSGTGIDITTILIIGVVVLGAWLMFKK